MTGSARLRRRHCDRCLDLGDRLQRQRQRCDIGAVLDESLLSQQLFEFGLTTGELPLHHRLFRQRAGAVHQVRDPGNALLRSDDPVGAFVNFVFVGSCPSDDSESAVGSR